jgi:hypothetical protein
MPSNVSDIWIVDSGTDRVYQHTAAAGRTSGSQAAAASFALAAGNMNPQGIADPPESATSLRDVTHLAERGATLEPSDAQMRAIAVAALIADDEPTWLTDHRSSGDSQLELALLDDLYTEIGQA